MSAFQDDLNSCDREPIHIPGQIQSHGFLVVVDHEYKISHCSDNVSSLFPQVSVKIIGWSLRDFELLIGDDQPSGFIANLIAFGNTNESFEQVNPYSLNIDGTAFYLIISTAPGHYLLEFEPVIAEMDSNIQRVIGHSISKMLAAKNLKILLNNAALQVRNTIHYDRVMIYRFADDGHGEVVAEAKNDDLDTWMGLHYPASDIPKQARELYKRNLTRIITDVDATPSNISAAADIFQPLDLTNSQLRAVSPVHIQYLKNMDVASSFSISILYKGELWGLIACHNYTPRFIDYNSRESSKLLGQILSSALEFRQEETNQQKLEVFKKNLDVLTKQLQEDDSIEDALTKHEVNLLDVVDASGAVLVYENNITKLGITPSDEQLGGLIDWVRNHEGKSFYHYNNLPGVYPEAYEYREIASGMMVDVISKELDEYMIFFKPEQLQSVTWAGNPEKPLEINENGLLQISPRNSFKEWSQTVTATSLNWSVEEINSVHRLKEEISYALNQKAGVIRLLNERLQHAYDELDTFSYTISHDLKNPITAIKSYAQLLGRGKSFGESEQNLLGRIANRADQMNLMINAVLDYSRIGRSELEFVTIDAKALIQDIIQDISLTNDNRKLTITAGKTPELQGDPVMMLQIFSNLIGNAVKYSSRKETPRVHIEGVVNDSDICYSVKDNGIGIAAHDLPHVFELFNRMDNVQDIEGSGVGLAIVKRIVEKHNGRIWVESELNVGSVFYVSFSSK